MLLVSYDIADNKLRNKFAKFLKKFGHRLQYSVFEIDNSERFLAIVAAEIDAYYGKRFEQTDSVLIMKLSNNCEIIKYGYAKNDNEAIIIIE